MALAGSNISVEYERSITANLSMGLRGNFVSNFKLTGGKSDDEGDDYDWIYSVNGIGGGISLRLYPYGPAPSGFYLGPRMDFIQYSGTYEDKVHNKPPVDTRLSLGTVHGELGYKFLIARAVVIGAFIDAGYAFAEATDASSLLALMYLFGGGLYLGIAF